MRKLQCSVVGLVALLLTASMTFAGEPADMSAQRGPAPGTHGNQPKSHPPAPQTPKGGSVALEIKSHPQLNSRVEALLPAGTTLETAASGFRNQGQFIAALHVSHNLGIPFDQLKTQIVTNHRSLGQSIQMLKPGANSKDEAKRGETEAKQDLSTKN